MLRNVQFDAGFTGIVEEARHTQVGEFSPADADALAERNGVDGDVDGMTEGVVVVAFDIRQAQQGALILLEQIDRLHHLAFHLARLQTMLRIPYRAFDKIQRFEIDIFGKLSLHFRVRVAQPIGESFQFVDGDVRDAGTLQLLSQREEIRRVVVFQLRQQVNEGNQLIKRDLPGEGDFSDHALAHLL